MAGKDLEIRFPVKGENQRIKYAQTGPDFTTPYAVNCRSFGPLERRGRGGSRPGLSKYISTDLGNNITGMHKVTYIDGDGNHQNDLVIIVDGLIKVVSGSSVSTTTSYLLLNSGDYLLLNDGVSKIYSTNTIAAINSIGSSGAYNMIEAGGKLYIAGSTCQVYDPNAGSIGIVSNAPSNQPLIAVYRNRLILAGENHIWYASATNNFINWDFVTKYKKLSRAISGTTGDGGVIGNDITCLKAWEDEVLLIRTADDLWAIYGNPANDGSGSSRKVSVSHEVGPISQGAMAVTDGGLCVFLSRQGVYTWQIKSSEPPQRFSESIVPEELRDVNASYHVINVEYDKKEDGFYLFKTPANRLILHYKCNDDAASTVVVDSTENGDNGTCSVNTDTLSSAGKIGDGFNLNGTSDSISAPLDAKKTLYGNKNFAISAWVYHDAAVGSDDICGNQVGSTGYSFGINASRQLYFYGGYAGTAMSSISTDVISNATWTLVMAVVYNDTAYMYINGEEVTYGTQDTGTSGGVRDDSSLALRVGRSSNGFFDGMIDDFRFYDNQINEDAISFIYNSGSGTEDTMVPQNVGEHWFLELESRAFWRSKYQDDHQPRSIAKMPISGDSNIIMGCNDGYLRRHDRSATNDDGSSLESDILLGAIRLGGDGRGDGLIQQICSNMADSSGSITWAIVSAESAEEAIDDAIVDIEAGTTTSVWSTGTWTANFNEFEYPRVRGAWIVLWISANSVWAYETVDAVIESYSKLKAM